MKKSVLITVASSGIDKAFAELFAKERYNVVLASRSKEKLNEIARNLQSRYGTKTLVVSVDLSQSRGGQMRIPSLICCN